jgi:DNA-binding IclR family transcriptional regulator
MVAATVPAKPVNSVLRALAILRLLGAAERPLSLSEIAAELDLVASTVMYILRTLVHEGMVAVEPGAKRYRLGAGTLALARPFLERLPLARKFQPHLDALTRDHGVTALGIEWDGGTQLTVTAIACATTNFSVHANLGSTFPALTSATGRCFAAFGGWPAARIEAAFAELEWQQAPSYEAWLDDIRRARSDGYAADDGNYIAGVTALAVPVDGGAGVPVGAVTALALGGRFGGTARKRLIADLKAAGRALSAEAGAAAKKPRKTALFVDSAGHLLYEN